MHKIDRGYILPSAALTLKRKQIKYYADIDKAPEAGDVVYGYIKRIGEHSSLENVSGRIHMIHNDTRAIFVYGQRYAPDYYEGLLPTHASEEIDLLARSGLIGEVKTKNSRRKDPTRVKVLGYVCDAEGHVLNTRDFPSIQPKRAIKKQPRSRLILVCGTSMNSGKSMAAVACCRALTSAGHKVRASKITGTASLKDILHMNDAGATTYSDFTHSGYPSTYMLSREELIDIFNQHDLRYANNPKNFWVVELADGIIQRETAMLLKTPEITSRIHKFIFCANDAFGAIGGLHILKERFHLLPDAISGLCSASPLHVRELAEFTDIPIFNSAEAEVDQLASLLLAPHKAQVNGAKASAL